MPRPVKPRRISALPETRAFRPESETSLEVKLKFDEYEAIRLKDVEGLHQEDAAKHMQISRQTFQLILESARKKIGLALVEGRSILIDGGDVTVDICRYICATCGHEFDTPQDASSSCPNCGKREAICKPSDAYCEKCCRKGIGRKRCQKMRARLEEDK